MPQSGIILQARTGSTRMPQPVILPFYQEQSTLDLLLEKALVLSSEKLRHERVLNFVYGNPTVSQI